jgi:hypothetical protein
MHTYIGREIDATCILGGECVLYVSLCIHASVCVLIHTYIGREIDATCILGGECVLCADVCHDMCDLIEYL